MAVVGPTDADDCYQETWVSALRAYPEVRSTQNLRGWLLTIAHRKAIDCLRARTRSAVPVAPGLLPQAAVDDEYCFANGGPLAAVQQLPEKQRAAVALRFVLDADYRSIATMMGTSEEAARRNVHEGLRRLRKEYANDER